MLDSSWVFLSPQIKVWSKQRCTSHVYRYTYMRQSVEEAMAVRFLFNRMYATQYITEPIVLT